MAELKPIVLNLTDRGNCAVDYIDYFDEGHYGPDKIFFVNRFDDLTAVAKQMRLCLALQGVEGSLIHNSRHFIEGKWIEPLVSKDELYPQRAQYMIRFLLRIKFYGEYAYIDIGKRWDDTDPTDIIYVKPAELSIVNRCLISEKDANDILNLILDAEVESGKKLRDIGWEIYVPPTDSENVPSTGELSEGELYEKLVAQEELKNAVLFSDGDIILGDENGALGIG